MLYPLSQGRAKSTKGAGAQKKKGGTSNRILGQNINKVK